MKPDGWEIDAEEHRFEEHLGRRALLLDRGVATANGVVLRDGVIEFDIAVPSERGFSGILWRVVDGDNHEEFYLRHHLSGQPDACQYTPVFNGLRGWQLYSGPHFSAPVEFPANQWIRIKLVVEESRADIYIDSDEPVLHIPELKRSPQAGRLAFKSTFAPAWFSKLSYRPLGDERIVGQPADVAPPPEHMVTEWMVSPAFPKGDIEGRLALPDDSPDANWRRSTAEASGLLNVARSVKITDRNDTAFARLRIDSAEEQKKLVRFGFSDEVRVFLNGELLFVGSDGFLSRDDKFMGTVGLFDSVVLPLKRGKNDLLFAVSEGFGGWGLLAQFEDPSGLQFQER
ncbi:MAG: hypothetical protein AAGK22_29560 [Acidobacteriota bacterium]